MVAKGTEVEQEQLVTTIVAWLAAKLERPIPALDVHMSFRRLGVDPGIASELAFFLEAVVGRAVAPAAIWRYSTPSSLAAHLTNASSGGGEDGARIACLLAASADELRGRVQAMLEAVQSGTPWLSFCGPPTSWPRRSDHRLALTAGTSAALVGELEAFLDGRRRTGVRLSRPEGGPARIAFVFSGQGGQWFGMARGLLCEPVFYEVIEECSHWVEAFLGWSLVDLLTSETDPSSLDRIEISLPAIVAVEIAVAAQWKAWGVRPDFVVGLSAGEVAAAHVAGALSVEDAMRTIGAYGQTLARMRRTLGMGVVGLSWDAADAELKRYEGRLFRAIQHSFDSTVVAGEAAAIDELFEGLRSRDIFCRRVPIDVAPHCPLFDDLRDELLARLREVRPREATVPFVSEVTGTIVPGEALDAHHWVRNVGDASFFSKAIHLLIDAGVDVFIELGPHPVALPAIEANLRRADRLALLLPSLLRGRDERESMFDALRHLYESGCMDEDVGPSTGPSDARRDFRPLSLADASGGSTLGDRLLAVPPHERENLVLALVRGEVATALGIDSPRDIPSDRALTEVGLDSVLAVALRNRLSAATGLSLNSTLLFNYPTIASLGRFLTARLDGSESTAPSASTAVAHAEDEAIAVVAMSARFPGNVETPEDLWDLLLHERDAISALPHNRGWDVALYDPDPAAPGKSYAREGGFLYDADHFDPAFFGISPREALAIDPQQRLLLETSWELFERSGIVPTTLEGTRTGVFVGVIYSEYGTRIERPPSELEAYMQLGSFPSVASGRIAYTFDLQGPTVTVDTACSSSLVAIHLACQSLRRGECSLALAGGVTVMATPATFIGFSRQRAGAPDGRCKAFSADANGAGWSEGAGMLLLERLSDARRHGRSILGTVRGSAVNQDGRSQGLSAPNGLAQERVIRDALAAARLDPRDVDAVEAHGTGTALGDPIEANALFATYGRAHDREQPLWLGSLKSNVGHTQSAAGVGGVIKMLLAMQRGLLPKTLHAQEPSPHIDWSSGAIRLLSDAVPWPSTERPRRAGVSSFGVSGTNAHVVLEASPASAERPRDIAASAAPVPLLLSAKSDAALRAQAKKLRQHLDDHPDLDPLDVAYSLATSRSHFDHRAALVVPHRADLPDVLGALAEGIPSPHAVVGHPVGAGKVVFVFPGQGTQWEGMARELLAASDVFRDHVEACERAFAPWVDWSLTAVLRAADGAPPIDRLDIVQPVLFAVMVGLAAHWRSLGIEPDAVIGHSQGEIAAACVAGALSLDDAARVVTLRSRALIPVIGKGAMAAVPLPAAELEPYLSPYGERVSVAAVNSPGATTISGVLADVEALVRELESKSVSARLLRIDWASHCALVEGARESLLRDLAPVRPQPSSIPVYSTLLGRRLVGTELDADYWYRNVREPVRFLETTRILLDDGHAFFIEVSPHPALSFALTETSEALDHRIAVIPSLRRNEGGLGRLLLSLGELHTRGCSFDWKTFFEPLGARRVALPTYPFQRRRYWLDAGTSRNADVASLGLASADHPMVGAVVALADGDGFLFTTRLSLSDHPWLSGHVVFGHVILPGTAFVELALVAARHVGLERVDELTLEAPLLLSSSSAVRLQISVGATDDAGRRALSIYGRDDGLDDGPWTRFASGRLASDDVVRPFELEAWPPPGAVPVPIEQVYPRRAAAGIAYGADFRGLRAVYRRKDDLFAEVTLPEALTEDASRYAIHPALLDAALHALAAQDDGPGDVLLPFSWGGIQLHAVGATTLRVRITRPRDTSTVSLAVADASGRPVARVDALTMLPASADQLAKSTSNRVLLRVVWTPLSNVTSHRPRGSDEHWALIGPGHDRLVPALRSTLRQVDHYPDLDTWMAALALAAGRPDTIVVSFRERTRPALGGRSPNPPFDLVDEAHQATERALLFLKRWIGEDRSSSTRLVLLTHGAIVTAGDDPSGGTATSSQLTDLVEAPLWGLARSAQTENPDLAIFLVDSDEDGDSYRSLVSTIADHPSERQLALRHGRALAPRLAAPDTRDTLHPPVGTATWHLDTTKTGSLDGLAIVPHPEALSPLADGQVRVAVRAAGLNFRDVVMTLGLVPGDRGTLGCEGAGVVLEVGPGVSELVPGDRVMGVLFGGLGPIALADHRLLTRIPRHWSFAEAASVPAVFLTAYYCLIDLARVQPGERVLVHAAAGGVGMAATQLARHLGAEVFGTASSGKWDTLRSLGFDDAHLASSRSLEFEQHFLRSTHGDGVDVVINSLVNEFTDASLRLLPRGGRFVEIGKVDVRDPNAVAGQYSGVLYHFFDLVVAAPDRTRQILQDLTRLFEKGLLHPPTSTGHDIRHAPLAFRALAQARRVGKVVFTVPRPLDANGTVLVTGGTGTLGGLLARHLVRVHGARHLLLTSRQGSHADGALVLKADLEASGAHVTLAACDVSNRAELEALFTTIPEDHPLTAVVHATGSLDDGLLTTLTPARLRSVLRSKLDGAVHLHELTQSLDLSAFVLYSSVAGVLGNAGQANYAAANSFLDALAEYRRGRGLPALSLDWGYWQDKSRLTAHLSDADLRRFARTGLRPVSEQTGLALFDAALGRPESVLFAAPLDLSVLTKQADALHPIFRGLLQSRSAPAIAKNTPAAASFKQQLLSLSDTGRHSELLRLARSQAALVLALSPSAIEPDRPLKELGVDSLMAVEIRNRLAAATGVRLRSTLLFDHPTPNTLATFLMTQMFHPRSSVAESPLSDDDVRRALSTVSIERLREANLLESILRIANEPTKTVPPRADKLKVASMTPAELIELALGGTSGRGQSGEPKS